MWRRILISGTAAASVFVAMAWPRADEGQDAPSGNGALRERLPAGEVLTTAEELLKRLDKNGDGKLTKDEIPEKLNQRLSQVDADGDGTITKDELLAARKRLAEAAGKVAQAAANVPTVEQIFNKLDKNGDGTLSKDELPEPMAQRLQQADINGDGTITKNELEDARKKIFAQAGGVAANFEPGQMLARFDKNGDGKLTLDELPEPLAVRLKEVDTDGDGAISKAELSAALKQRLNSAADDAIKPRGDTRPEKKQPGADGRPRPEKRRPDNDS